MRETKLLLVVTVVFFCVTQAQCSYLKEVLNTFVQLERNSGSDFYTNKAKILRWWKESLTNHRKIKKGILDRYEEISVNITQQVNDRQPLKDADINELIDKIPTPAWFSVEVDYLDCLSKDKLNKLLSDGSQKLPSRVLYAIEMLKSCNATKDEVLAELRTDNFDIPEPVLECYARTLGHPSKLREQEIDSYGVSVIRKLPPTYLRRITNIGARKKLNDLLKICLAKGKERCRQYGLLEALVLNNYMVIYGPISSWTSDNVTDVGLQYLIPEKLAQLPDKTILDIKSQLLRRQRNFNKFNERRILLEALAKAENVSSMTLTELITWMDSIDSLKDFVLPYDLPEGAMDNSEVRSTVSRNLKDLAGKGQLDPQTSRITLAKLLKNKSANTITRSQAVAMEGFLGLATPELLQKLINRDVLRSENLKSMSKFLPPDGPGSKSRGVIMTKKIKDADGVSVVPPELSRFLSASEIISNKLSSTDVKTRLTECNIKSCQMNQAQKRLMVDKVFEHEKPSLGSKFKCLIPTNDYSTQTLAKLIEYAKGTSPMSAMSLQAADKAFGSLTNITWSEINPNTELMSSMGSANAAKVNLEVIETVLKKINQETTSLPIDVSRTLAKRLLLFAMENRGVKDEEELGATLTYKDIDNMPPSVIAALGEKAVMAIHPVLKLPLLLRMGKSGFNSGITRKMKRLIINEGTKLMIGDMEDLEVTMDLLEYFRSASIDLPAEFTGLFDMDATRNYLTLLEVLITSGLRPCLDSKQREEIGKMIEVVYGHPKMWNNLEGRSCLLEFLSEYKISQINQYVIENTSCVVDTSCEENIVDAWESLCEMEIGSDERYRREDILKKINERRLEAAIANAESLNAKKRKKREADVSDCNRVAIAGAGVLTEDEIKQMFDTVFLDCFDKLGLEDMSESLARVVFKKLESAKGDSQLTLQNLEDLGYIWKGLWASEVKDLRKISFGTINDVIFTLGHNLGLKDDVREALATKVLREGKASNTMTATDLVMIGQLICGFNASTIEVIPKHAIQSVMPLLGLLTACNCNYRVKQNLAKKAVEAYGDITIWNSAIVTEIGCIIGGLDAEKLKTIPPSAMNGLTIKGIHSIPPSSIKEMEVAQQQQLPMATLLVMSEDQFSKLSDIVKAPTKEFMAEHGGRAGAGMVSFTLPVSLMTLAFLLILV